MPKPKTVPNKLLIGFSDEQLVELDNWRRKQDDLPSRSEGVRRLVDGGLEQTGVRETWRGFLRLSLVTCPVELIPATDTYTYIETDDDIALESTRVIEIGEFVPPSDIDPRYMIRPYYLVPDGKVGHDAFAVIREATRAAGKVAIGRVVLTNKERQIALYPHDEGMVGMLLRYSSEVRNTSQSFGSIQHIKITKEMLDLARHIVEHKSAPFDPDKFESRRSALTEPRVEKQKRQPIASSGGNVINLMDALKKMLISEKSNERLAATRK
jgi:DNA end-binding protein Ku